MFYNNSVKRIWDVMLRKSDITCYKETGYKGCVRIIVFFTTLFGQSNI